MRNALLKKFDIPYKNLPKISTLHALGFEIVKLKPNLFGLRKGNLEVQDNVKVKELLYRDASSINGFEEDMGKESKKCKEYGDCTIEKETAQCSICKKYWEIMAKCNRIDFDDQIIFANRLLEKDDVILKEYQKKAKFLLVDEYQDINAAQFKLIELLSRRNRNGLFAVGDDAQSIYGFRGTDPNFILKFGNHFPEAIIPPLKHSWRCHKNTMDAAIRVLSNYYKKWTGPHELKFHVKNGAPPEVFQLSYEGKEAEFVANKSRDAVKEKKHVLILVPKKEFFPKISEALNKYGIPHQCPINLLSKYTNERFNIIWNILTWIKNPNDNFLTRLVLEDFINHGAVRVPGAKKSNSYKPATIEKRIKIEQEVAYLWESVDRKHDLFSVLSSNDKENNIISKVHDYLKALLEAFHNYKEQDLGMFSKLLSEASGVWCDPKKLSKDLLSISNLLGKGQPLGFGSVQMMTMRKAKGLEADVVIIVGLEDGIFPNPRADLEEEARLLYVSMTRAKEKLYLLHSYRRPRNISFGPDITGKKRSCFLDKLGLKSTYKR